MLRRLNREELPHDTVELARYLIGKTLVSQRGDELSSGRIVETEAYLPDDASSHSFRGKTARNASMFLTRGFAYVYFIYGSCFCLNVTGDAVDVGAAVLVRALEPLDGLEIMMRRRQTRKLRDLARGPGRLAQALAIDRDDDGVDLCTSATLWLADNGAPQPPIGTSVRIGISRETERPHRFFALGSSFVSGPVSLGRVPSRRKVVRTTD